MSLSIQGFSKQLVELKNNYAFYHGEHQKLKKADKFMRKISVLLLELF